MKVKPEETIAYKMQQRLQNIASKVVLRKDFSDLGGDRLISQGLKKLINDKKLVRIGFGVYAKSYQSRAYQNVTLIEGGTDLALREALNRLDIRWEPGSAEDAYNKGSTQIPIKNIVKLKDRCRRKLGYKRNQLIFEGNINAK